MISHAQFGMTHKEMRKLLRVEVQKPLRNENLGGPQVPVLLVRRLNVCIAWLCGQSSNKASEIRNQQNEEVI